MADKKEDELLSAIGDDTLRDIRALSSTREGRQLREELKGIDPQKLLKTFAGMDKETIKKRLKGVNAASLKKALESKDFLDKLK